MKEKKSRPDTRVKGGTVHHTVETRKYAEHLPFLPFDAAKRCAAGARDCRRDVPRSASPGSGMLVTVRATSEPTDCASCNGSPKALTSTDPF